MVSEPFLPVITAYHWRRMERVIQRRNAEHDLWSFKDPRVCSFMMVWKHLLPGARALLIYRHFSDATYSLGRRQSVELLSDRKSTRLNSSHANISYAVFCLKKKKHE